jgi:hypothetical protein
MVKFVYFSCLIPIRLGTLAICPYASAAAVTPCNQGYYQQQYLPTGAGSIDDRQTLTSGRNLALAAVAGATSMYVATKAKMLLKRKYATSKDTVNSSSRKTRSNSSHSYSRDASAIERVTSTTAQLEKQRRLRDLSALGDRSDRSISSISNSGHSRERTREGSKSRDTYSGSHHLILNAKLRASSIKDD